MSDTVVNALGIGAAVLIVVPLATVVLVLLRSQLTNETALAATMLTVAALVACVELLMSAWLSEMRTALNLFLPLVVSNLIVVHHLQARHDTPGDAVIGSVRIAVGIAITLLPLGIGARARRPRLAPARRGLERDQRVPRRHGIHARDVAARRVHLVRAAARGRATGSSAPPVKEQRKSRRQP